MRYKEFKPFYVCECMNIFVESTLHEDQSVAGKNLRLLLFADCDRRCPGCCNKDWDLDALPVVKSFKGFREVILTGGEPMLNPNLVKHIASQVRHENPAARIIVYTAKTDNPQALVDVLRLVDGVTITFHKQKDVATFNVFNEMLKQSGISGKSLRLNVFKGIKLNGVDTTGWKLQPEMVWIKDCPLPKNEVFMRYSPAAA